MSEAEFQRLVIDLAHLYGFRVAHFRPGMMRSGKWVTPVQADGAGFPDLLMLRGNRQIVAELKVCSNKPSAAQEAWLKDFALAGVEQHLWKPSDWKAIEEALAR